MDSRRHAVRRLTHSSDPVPVRRIERGPPAGISSILEVVGSLAGGRAALYSPDGDRKSTRLNSSHSQISYAAFCLKKKHFPRSRNRTRNPSSASGTLLNCPPPARIASPFPPQLSVFASPRVRRSRFMAPFPTTSVP